MDSKMLAAALLWLLNHYDGGKPECHDAVVQTIEEVLKLCQEPPTEADMKRFRELYLD